jgi:hypothetical protein
MAAMYEKPVRLLMKDMVAKMEVKPGDIILREKVFEWFRSHYPKIKESTLQAHLIRLSTNVRTRYHYGANPNGDDDLFFRIDPGRFRLYEPTSDPAPIYDEQQIGGPGGKTEGSDEEKLADENASEFAYERDLQSFLSKNLQLIEPGLRLYKDDEDESITGVEFPAGGRFIDILALDKNDNYVVIELKVSRGYDRVVGQLLRYMAWIEKHHADSGQGVRGIIIAKNITEDLALATAKVKDVDLFEYELSVSLKKINASK